MQYLEICDHSKLDFALSKLSLFDCKSFICTMYIINGYGACIAHNYIMTVMCLITSHNYAVNHKCVE